MFDEPPNAGGSMQEQASRDRKTMWALAIGGLGVVVAIVALVIALSANSASNDDAKIAGAVKQEANLQIGGIRAELQKNATAATAVLTQLQGSSAQAGRARSALRREVSANKGGVASNAANIKVLQASVARLDTKVTGLKGSVAKLTQDLKALTVRVTNLEKKHPSGP